MNKPLAASAVVISFALTISAVPIYAQVANEDRISIAAGAGVANPLHADLQFNAPAWQLSVRWPVSPLLAVDASYGEWRRSDRVVHEHLQIQGLNGFLGTIDRFTQNEQYVTRTAGLNVLLRHSVGRVAFWGGGGPAYIQLDHRYKQSESGCTGSVSCNEFETTHTAADFAVQGTAGLDIRLTGRLAAFGQYGFSLPIQDPGSGHAGVSGGVRVALW